MEEKAWASAAQDRGGFPVLGPPNFQLFYLLQCGLLEGQPDRNGERPPRDLAAHLARIRSRGYEERASYEVDGVINISFPVLDDRGRAIAALTVPFLQRIGDRTTPATVREVLQKASVLLSGSMGGVTAEAAS